MNQDRDKRKLTAILSADVVGYSRLMEADQAWTIKNLGENKDLISDLVEDYKGRVVDAPGDNILAEFSSVTNAVECAVKIQQELKKKNANIVENRRMEFRIGVNLGEVFEEEGRIYGSGVNIAARIENLSKSGGICISGRTYDHIKTQLDLDYEYLGEHNVKNISEPIRVYRVLSDLGSTGKIVREQKSTSISSHKTLVAATAVVIIIIAGILFWKFYPSQNNKTEQATAPEVKEAPKTIAVLPFEDYSPEEDQKYFVNGLSEEILNTITQIPGLSVSGRTSSFSFQNSNKTVNEIAEILGVENVLEGSVRKAGNTLRITAQLLRAKDGFHLWSKNYDRELKGVADILAIQEDIAIAVADELKITLGIKPFKQLGGTDNMEAYELYLAAKGHFNDLNASLALESVNKAIALDPSFALGWAMKSMVYVGLIIANYNDLRDECLKSALRAIELEPRLGKAYLSLGSAHTMRGEFIEAGNAYKRAMELTKESIDYFDHGLIPHYVIVGHLKKSLDLLIDAKSKDPLHPLIRGFYIGDLTFLGDFELAEKEHERGKVIFGNEWTVSDFPIIYSRLYLATKNSLPIKDLPEMPEAGVSYAIAKEFIDSPKEGLSKLRNLYYNDKNLPLIDRRIISSFAAYFGDPVLAFEATGGSKDMHPVGLMELWHPLFNKVRQLPRFKEYVREIGLLDYWKEYGWPDLCHPVGADDFVCE